MFYKCLQLFYQVNHFISLGRNGAVEDENSK